MFLEGISLSLSLSLSLYIYIEKKYIYIYIYIYMDGFRVLGLRDLGLFGRVRPPF